ncbi:hypothetical protein E2C01_004652 [Portunus trituberculatus]|uniref:Uncharacterized protein n=1 Tax=Portunus trituberculatus TaxID=210409 RepID=A0A5B7CRX8_PORTR|nr:hypothetical protein [Portunus trituberculatus]
MICEQRKSLPAIFCTTTSQELLEREQHMMVDRMASVAYTLLSSVLRWTVYIFISPTFLNHCILFSQQSASAKPHLSDNGVISGGDLVEDAIDAGQLLLILDSDAVVGLVVVLQGATQVPLEWGLVSQ